MFRELWVKHPRAEAALMLVAALAFVVIALGGYMADRGLAERGVTTTATVLGVDRGRDMDTYSVRRVVPSGQTITAETAFAVGDYQFGDDIPVEYDAADPSSVAEVGSRRDVWILYGTFGLVVLGALGRAIWLLRQPRASGR